ncbi:ribosome biogenesis factor YjgA [Panacagrimonas sp.]|uniref:ribosome biogenesis factor YjgA n=1 Tax=Panacagrimonas sp. TaxID=2480088 RepID=UPI003B51FC42
MTGYTDRDPPQYDGPSKTQVKQQMLDLQEIGVELLKLSGAQLANVPMDDRLRAALREHGRMPTREAKRRHMQFIGRLLRETDAEPARQALIDIRTGEARVLAHAERWREDLLAADTAMTDWIARYPHSQIQPLRNLVRKARRELAELEALQPEGGALRSKSRAYKELFQVLRGVLRAAPMLLDAPEDDGA